MDCENCKKECELCKSDVKSLNEKVQEQDKSDLKPLEKIKKKIMWKQVFIGAISAVLAVVIIFISTLTYVTMHVRPIYYNEIKDDIVLEENGNVRITIAGKNSSGTVSYIKELGKNPETGAVKIAIYRYVNVTIWDEHISSDGEGYIFDSSIEHSSSSKDGIKIEDEVVAVYYQVFEVNNDIKDMNNRYEFKDEPVLIWEKQE